MNLVSLLLIISANVAMPSFSDYTNSEQGILLLEFFKTFGCKFAMV